MLIKLKEKEINTDNRDQLKELKLEELLDLKSEVGQRFVLAKARARQIETRQKVYLSQLIVERQKIHEMLKEQYDVKSKTYNVIRAEALASQDYQSYIDGLLSAKEEKDYLKVLYSDINNLIKMENERIWHQ